MIVEIFLPLSLIFIMFTLGIGLTITDFSNVLHHPRAFVVGIVNQMVLLPLVAFLISIFFSLSNEMAVGMMILACCPGGVTSNIITKIAGGDTALSISYTAVVSIVTVITLPIVVSFSMNYFMGSEAPPINILSLGITMFIITTAPVCAGLYINTMYNNLTTLLAPFANKISTALFVVIVLGALASEWTTFINNLYILGPAVITLIIIMLSIGYKSAQLSSLNKPQAVTIAIESGIQNATVGITIGSIIMPSSVGISVLGLTSGVYGILMYLVCLPCVYIFFRNK